MKALALSDIDSLDILVESGSLWTVLHTMVGTHKSSSRSW